MSFKPIDAKVSSTIGLDDLKISNNLGIEFVVVVFKKKQKNIIINKSFFPIL
jgi:hypothetical protein